MLPGRAGSVMNLLRQVNDWTRGRTRSNFAAMPDLPPGPRTPRLLQILEWIRRPIPFMQTCARTYGSAFTLRWPGEPPVAFFSEPAAIKQIFTADPERLQAGQANVVFKPIVGSNSVLLLDGARHKRARKLLMPPFHGERIRLYGDVMGEVADRSIDDWPVDTSFPLHAQMQRITLDVILRIVFGMEEGARLARLRTLLIEYFNLVGNNPLLLVRWLRIDRGPLTAWTRTAVLARAIDTLLYDEIARRKAVSQDERTDVMAMLVAARDEDGQPMSDAEIRDEMITILLTGHETTATSMAWVMYRLLQHPEVLETARREVASVFGNGRQAAERVAELGYLDAVIKETARLHPIVPIVLRHLEAPTRIGDFELPAGSVAAPCIYLTHRRPDVWPDPETFRPERFIGRRMDPYAFFPFGGGARHCLGAAFATYEMKVVLARVLARVSLRPDPAHTVRTVRRGITLAPSGGLPVVRATA